MAFYIFLFLSLSFFIVFIAFRSARAKRLLSTPQGIGELFAADCLDKARKQARLFVRARPVDDIEHVRLGYCFLILNYSILVWWTNRLEDDILKVKTILDTMTENLQIKLKKAQESCELKYMVVDKEELENIISELSKDCNEIKGVKIDENIKMTLSTLSGFILERRADVYYALLSELAEKSLIYENAPKISPLAKAFIKQFLGAKSEHDTLLAAITTNIINLYIDYFGMLCSEAIKKLNPSKVS